MAALYIVEKHIPLMQHCFSFLSFLLFWIFFFFLLCAILFHYIILRTKKVLKERLIHVHQRSLYVSLSLPFFNRFIVHIIAHPPVKNTQTETSSHIKICTTSPPPPPKKNKKETPTTTAPCRSQIRLDFLRSHSNQGSCD